LYCTLRNPAVSLKKAALKLFPLPSKRTLFLWFLKLYLSQFINVSGAVKPKEKQEKTRFRRNLIYPLLVQFPTALTAGPLGT